MGFILWCASLQVDAERTYHQTVADILNKLHDEVHN
jgi:hypothetical protein